MGNELPNWMKISLLCISVVCFFTAFILIVIPETFISMIDPTLLSHFDSISLSAILIFIRADGILVFSFGIFSLVALRVNDFEKIKMYLEFAILWVNLAIVLNIYGVIIFPTMIINLLFKVVIDFIYLYYYINQIRQ